MFIRVYLCFFMFLSVDYVNLYLFTFITFLPQIAGWAHLRLLTCLAPFLLHLHLDHLDQGVQMSSMTISLGIFMISELAATSLIHNRPCSVARADSCPDLSRSRLLFFEYFFGVCTNVFVESTCKLKMKNTLEYQNIEAICITKWSEKSKFSTKLYITSTINI